MVTLLLSIGLNSSLKYHSYACCTFFLSDVRKMLIIHFVIVYDNKTLLRLLCIVLLSYSELTPFLSRSCNCTSLEIVEPKHVVFQPKGFQPLPRKDKYTVPAML